MPTDPFSIDCTGDVVIGDHVRFKETVFQGPRHRKPTAVGSRTIEARVVADSYGSAKQQHTFSLEVTRADGFEAPAPGTRLLRKGRNVYRHGCWRRPWSDEGRRRLALREKHRRGDRARADRQARTQDA